MAVMTHYIVTLQKVNAMHCKRLCIDYIATQNISIFIAPSNSLISR